MDTNQAYHRFFEMCLRRMHNLETLIKESLDKMIETAQTGSLKQALIHHRDETIQQIKRLDKIFKSNDIELNPPKEGISGAIDKGKEMLQTIAEKITRHSSGIQEYLNEGQTFIEEFKKTDIIDFALASTAMMTEHIEIASYQILIQIADHFGMKEASDLLKKSLQEEQHMAEIIQEQLPTLSHIQEKAS